MTRWVSRRTASGPAAVLAAACVLLAPDPAAARQQGVGFTVIDRGGSARGGGYAHAIGSPRGFDDVDSIDAPPRTGPNSQYKDKAFAVSDTGAMAFLQVTAHGVATAGGLSGGSGFSLSTTSGPYDDAYGEAPNSEGGASIMIQVGDVPVPDGQSLYLRGFMTVQRATDT